MPVKVGLKHIELWNECMEDQILAYERDDEGQGTEKGQIVFYGPSCFTRWSARRGNTPMREVLLGKSGRPCVINRGFGSSCSEHQLYYYPRMIRPLAPKVLVYECYYNAGAFGYSLEERWELAQRVLAYAMTDFPGIHIYLCGPHPGRDMDEGKLEERRIYGEWLKAYAQETPNCTYVDVMAEGSLRDRDIFVEDGVHFNQEGYRRYGEFFKKVLAKELERY